MQRASAAPDIGTRPSSQGTIIAPNMRQSMPTDNLKRSRSNTSVSMNRPKSRASTTSLHSTTTIENDQSQPVHAMTETQQTGQNPYNASHNALMMAQASHQQRQQMSSQQGFPIHQHVGGPHAHNMHQPASFAFDTPAVNQQGFVSSNPHDAFAMQPDYAGGRHADSMSVAYADFDGLENDSPALDDSELADFRKKRSSTSTQQNEIELKRLLEQYQGRSLRDVAVEVQRTDNGGGKSEKVKQVFAMLWLQENCRKSGGSVRRDRVFSCYAKKCGNEAVPTLNPASFGKLVRIIFSDVKTRRLGVRGESKYHYVDLSLVPEAEQDVEDLGEDFMFKSAGDMNHPQMRRSQSHQRSLQAPTETADFPAPSTTHVAQMPQQSPDSPLEVPKPVAPLSTGKLMECRYLGQPLITVDTSKMPKGVRDVLNQQLPKTSSGAPYLITYLAHPPETPKISNPDEQIELPDIHSYLEGENYDVSIANNLTNLYRSYCICVTDAFRYCKEKPFFHHHSAFNGNMTVPVQKLLSHERLAPWILECDMRMYKRMIGFVTPLTTQVVPKQVLDAFDRICAKLVNHLVESFEKMPAHVVAAKVIPATRFVHLLSKLPKVNSLAQSTHALLQNPANRTQMWLDLLQMTDPNALIEDAHFTPDALPAAEGILRHEYKALLTPMDESLASQFENNNVAWTSFLTDPTPANEHITSSIFDPTELVTSGVLDRWIQHVTNLHLHFPDHTPKCIINHHNSLWRAILADLGINGANTYQAWWTLEIFLSSMISWLVELAGFGDPEVQEAQNKIEEDKRKEDEKKVKAWDLYRKQKAEWDAYQDSLHGQNQRLSQYQQGTKRKRNDVEDESNQQNNTTRSASVMTSISSTNETQSAAPSSRPSTRHLNHHNDFNPNSAIEAETPSTTTSPASNTRSKRPKPISTQEDTGNNEDSGIGLDLAIEDDGDVEDLFRSKAGVGVGADWGILSDSADAAGDVVVV